MNKSTLGAGKGGEDGNTSGLAKQEQRTTRCDDYASAITTCIVTKLQPNDVLMGRGSNVMLHQGNIQFIEIIRSRCAEYQSISSRKQKHIIAQQIVSTVRNKKGLFLRKIESSAAEEEEAQKRMGVIPDSSAAEQMAMWTLVEEGAILLKVKQALRDQSLVMSKRISEKEEGTQQHPNKPNEGPKKKRARVVVANKVATLDGLR